MEPPRIYSIVVGYSVVHGHRIDLLTSDPELAVTRLNELADDGVPATLSNWRPS